MKSSPSWLLSSYAEGLEHRLKRLCPYTSIFRVKRDDTGLSIDIDHLHEEVVSPSSATAMISSASGMGKTVLSITLALKELHKGRVALWLPLRWVQRQEPNMEGFIAGQILEVIRGAVRKSGIRIDSDQIRIEVEKILAGESVLIILDGYNELPLQHQPTLFREFIINKYWHKFVLLGRTKNNQFLEHIELDDYVSYSIPPLENDEIEKIIAQYPLLGVQQKTDFFAKLCSMPVALEIARIPNVLIMQLEIYAKHGDVFDSLGQLYFELLRRTHQPVTSTLPFQDWMSIVGAVAAEMNNRGWFAVSPHDAPRMKSLWDSLDSNMNTFKVWRDSVSDSLEQTLAEPNPQLQYSFETGLEFFHQSWQDFFAGYWLSLTWPNIPSEERQRIIATPTWEDALIFASFFLDEEALLDYVRTVTNKEGIALRVVEILREASRSKVLNQTKEIVSEAVLNCFIRSDFPVNRIKAFDQLYELGAFELLARGCDFIISHEHWLMRECAARFMGELSDPSRKAALLALLKDSCLWVRAAAAWALGLLSDSSVHGHLTALADSEQDCFVRRWCSAALIISGWPRLSRHREWYVESFENELFGPRNTSTDPLSYFTERLTCDDEWIRASAVEAITDMRPSSALQLFAGMIDDHSLYVRSWVMRGVGYIGGSTARQLIMKGMQDPDPWVKTWALYATAHLRLVQARPVVQELINSNDLLVGDMAKFAWRAIAPGPQPSSPAGCAGKWACSTLDNRRLAESHPEISRTVREIKKVITEINDISLNKSREEVFVTSNHDVGIYEDLEQPCSDIDDLQRFARALYLTLFERTANWSDRGGTLPHKSYSQNLARLPHECKHKNQFVNIVGCLRHHYGGHLTYLPTFKTIGYQLSKGELLEKLLGTRNEPDEKSLIDIQEKLLTMFLDFLMQVRECIKKPDSASGKIS